MRHNFLQVILLGTLWSLPWMQAFVVPAPPACGSTSTLLHAKKKSKKKNAGGQGFAAAAAEAPNKKAPAKNVIPSEEDSNSNFLTSIPGGSTDIPEIDDSPVVDESIPVEERTAAILRDKYKFRTMEEQREEERKSQTRKEQQKKLQEWKQMADKGEDFDLIASLPEPLLIFIDRFLKAGVAICTVLFVLAGGAITLEAWSKASENPLPDDIDAFITNTVEPNFTPGLLVLLTFSISLGAFAALQLASDSSTYRERK